MMAVRVKSKKTPRQKETAAGRKASRERSAPRRRPGWNEYFLGIAALVSQRSTCLRRQVGALIVKDKRILSTGYNGTPMGIEHCDVTGCLRERLGVPSGERHELCLPPDEEVFTAEGFIPISKIRVGQRVLTHKGFYRKVTKRFKRRYDGKLYHIKPWNLLPVALTPAHPVLVMRPERCQFDERTLCKASCRSVNNAYCSKPYLKYCPEWIPAEAVQKKDLVFLTFDHREHTADMIDFSCAVDAPRHYYEVLEARENGKTYRDIKRELKIWPGTAYNWVQGGAPRDTIVLRKSVLQHGSSPAKTVPAHAKLTDPLLRLIGFYLAEGCSSGNQLSFSFHKKEKGYIEEIKSTMKDVFGLDCYENIFKNKQCHVLVYSSVVLAKAFKYLFGENAYKKRLPRFLLRLPVERQKHILHAYRQGDGYHIDENTFTITTASKQLALQTTQIILRLGYIPMIDRERSLYRVIWKDKRKIPYGYFKDNAFITPVRNIEVREYSGYVHNLEVEKDNSYVTKSFVVHNCRGLHAEQNALLQASYHGVSVKDGIVYCTNQPCIICAKMIINAGIREVVIRDGYPDKMAMGLFEEAGLKLRAVKRTGLS